MRLDRRNDLLLATEIDDLPLDRHDLRRAALAAYGLDCQAIENQLLPGDDSLHAKQIIERYAGWPCPDDCSVRCHSYSKDYKENTCRGEVARAGAQLTGLRWRIIRESRFGFVINRSDALRDIFSQFLLEFVQLVRIRKLEPDLSATCALDAMTARKQRPGGQKIPCRALWAG